MGRPAREGSPVRRRAVPAREAECDPLYLHSIRSGRCRSDPFDLEPALEEPVLNLLLALKLGHLHELTSKVAGRELLHLVVLHPIATRPHDLGCVRIEEGAIVWVRFKRATPDDPRRVIRMPEEKPIGVSLQPQRLHATLPCGGGVAFAVSNRFATAAARSASSTML